MSSPEEACFTREAEIITAMHDVLAYARQLMPGGHHFTIANVLFGASMRAVEEADGPAGGVEFARQALQAIAALEERDGRDH